MVTFSYLAKRKIATGHTAAVPYDFVSDVQTNDLSVKVEAKHHTSFDGNKTETIYQRYNETVNFKLAPTDQLELLHEFIYSAMSGESITIDDSGDIYTAVILPSPRRDEKKGGFETWSFTVKKV